MRKNEAGKEDQSVPQVSFLACLVRICRCTRRLCTACTAPVKQTSTREIFISSDFHAFQSGVYFSVKQFSYKVREIVHCSEKRKENALPIRARKALPRVEKRLRGRFRRRRVEKGPRRALRAKSRASRRWPGLWARHPDWPRGCAQVLRVGSHFATAPKML